MGYWITEDQALDLERRLLFSVQRFHSKAPNEIKSIVETIEGIKSKYISELIIVMKFDKKDAELEDKINDLDLSEGSYVLKESI